MYISDTGQHAAPVQKQSALAASAVIVPLVLSAGAFAVHAHSCIIHAYLCVISIILIIQM